MTQSQAAIKQLETEFTPEKAGVMLYENGTDGNRRLLVPYNEGRFAKGGLNLVLPKGSVDYHKGETAPRGAIRETGEETGFPLADFMGEENLAQFEAGEHLYNITNPRYPGVTLVHADPTPHLHDYHARNGNINSMAMYGFEITGMDVIAANYLKNPERKTAKELLDADRSRPRFPVFFDWMVRGEIPAQGDLPRVKLGNPQWFRRQIRDFAPGGRVTPTRPEGREQWQAFMAQLEKNDPEGKAYEKLCESFSAIKDRLRALGWIKGDDDILKFDDKDCPLFWYAEGAQEGPAHEIIGQTFRDMRDNRDYARAFGGFGTLRQGLPDDEVMMLGQIAAYRPFVSAHEWEMGKRLLRAEPGRPLHAVEGFTQRMIADGCADVTRAGGWAADRTARSASQQSAQR